MNYTNMFRIFWLCAILAGASFAQEKPVFRMTFQISGVLVDSLTGHPIRQGQVAVSPVTMFDSAASIVTGEDGRFVFPNLKPGKYNLRAQRQGYLAQSLNEHDGFSTAVAVGPNLESDNLVFRLSPECSISGRIFDEAGEPVTIAQISVHQVGIAGGRQGMHLRQTVSTDDEGFYHLGHLAPGKYLIAVLASVWYAQRPEPPPEAHSSSTSGSVGVFVSAQGTYSEEQSRSPLDVAYPITFYPGVSDANAAALIALKPGERFVADLSLQPVPALRVRIPGGRKTDGENAAPGYVSLRSRSLVESPFQLPNEARYLTSGDIDLVGVAPGHYEVEISDSNSNKKRFGEMEIFAGGEAHIEHETPSLNALATVHFEPGAALSHPGFLSLHNLETEAMHGGQLAKSGEVEFPDLRPGKYEVFLNGNNHDYIKAVSAVGATVNGRTLDIKGSGPVKLNIVIGHGEGEVNGVVLRDGKPLAGAMVVLAPSDFHTYVLFRRDQSDSDGTFTLRSIVPGKYILLALENGWDLEWTNPSILKPYLPGGEVLQVQPDGKYEVKVKVQ